MERVAFILLDLFRRARRSGLVKKNEMVLPITQLRATGCFSWTNFTFVMRDEAWLAGIAMASDASKRVRPFL